MPLPEGWQAKQLDRAGAWKERHFVRRTIYNRPIAPEDLLGAAAVMGIEIDSALDIPKLTPSSQMIGAMGL